MVKRWIGFLFLIAITGGVVLLKNYYLSTSPNQETSQIDSTTLTLELQPKEPKVVYGMVLDERQVVIEDKIKRNQRLGEILEQYNVPAKLINQISTLSRKVFDPRKIAADKKYTVIYEQDSLKKAKALVYEPNAIDYIIFKFDDSLSVDVRQREVITVEKTVTGVIKSNLSQTIQELGITNELTNKFVDIFGWQVDFQRLQKGDKFKLIYHEQQVEGTPVGVGQIDAIYFEHFGEDYYAFPFDQGNGIEYFDAEGKSMRKAFLKYPIEFTRISSRFTMNRFHPVQKRWKAHLGTDFAAPTGTPIRTVGDGIVLEAQYKSNNGNYVKIRHNATYTTQYLHMSKIAAGIRPGTRVRQGETIGYVGSTGLASGPHLCYRFWKNGVQVDGLRADLPASEPVRKNMREAFEVVKQELMQKLNTIPAPQEEIENVLASAQ
ncbi:peptidoglycan DD-metalloendopeptidase family protein [Chryseosolibacter indicus]|uniref:Peptidoglycan DD-metalloendopeptidase family protein n=1 Tax=Chryseosolibacter indicus TaxID=2782351 RepID=A0ABS5VU08_9BACT|nr:peptidoglycan DD-metalloendopeptidase family protein [Chryseosolibacter indicus]MBT1704369.1 peptidoglycan DD-metalloendopeptidase family protein [Chryseosolibacter indicus]